MTDLLQRSVGPSFNIETRFSLALKPVEVDANQLELAVLNLALNARDAMSNGGDIVLSVREESIADDHMSGLEAGPYIRLSVSDTGEGMDKETVRKAVEPFFTTKGINKGTGLGLSMVHGFAEQSGGRFILQSEKGKGTTATLWLPVTKSSIQPVVSTQTVSPKAGRPLTILVVDDDALVLMSTVAMLEDLGHAASGACAGQEALEILGRNDSIDLVITDQAMPNMTGTALAQVIKDKWPDIPVMIATGYADRATGYADRARDGLTLLKLTKPYDQRNLSDAIIRVNPPRRKLD
jgi:CheY-like chemotaxis protein/anti-sigma regulatory factor (Ser/Thr protein kinase)